MRSPKRLAAVTALTVTLGLAVLIHTTAVGAAAGAPGPVQGVNAMAGNGFVTASWTAPASDGGSPVFAYSVIAQRADASIAGWTNLLSDATSASVDGLANGVTYTIHVLAWTAAGRSAASTPATPSAAGASPTIAPRPRNLQVTFAESGFLSPTARWTAPPSDGGSPIVAYSMVTAYGRPPFLTYNWVHVGPHDRQATCVDCPANVVDVFAWTRQGPGEPAEFGMFPF